MSTMPKRFKFKSVGAMSYEVERLSDGAIVGLLWRTREGWSFRVTGHLPKQDTYGVSRETAAGVLAQAFDRAAA